MSNDIYHPDAICRNPVCSDWLEIGGELFAGALGRG